MPRQARQLAGIGASDLPNQAAVNAYKGPPREIVVGATRLHVQDGVTAGGIPQARLDEVIVAPTNGVVPRSPAERASDRPSVHDLAVIPPSAPDFASASAVAAKIREALANGLARNLRRIDVPGGVYDVASTEGTTGRGQIKAALAIDGGGRESVVVNFRGTKLMLSADLAGSYSSHLVVRNVGRIVLTGDLTLDWTKLPYAQGVCTSINATTKAATFLLDLDTAGGVPAFADVQRISRHDPANGMWLGTILEHNGITSAGRAITVVPVGDAAYAGVGTYRVDFSAMADQAALSSMVVGASYALVSNPVGNHGLHFDGVDEVDMSGLRLRIHCANGFGISGIVHRRFVIGRAVRIGPAYRSKRFLATTADGIHIVGTRDLCSIHARVSHTGDDGLNINISSNFVQNAVAPGKPARTFVIGVVVAGRVPEVGDSLQFETAAGAVSPGGKVVAVDATGGFASTPAITMDRDLPADFRGAADTGSSFETATRIHNLSDYATLDLDPIVSCTRNAGARVRGLGGRILGTWKDIPGPALYVACNLGLDHEGPNPSDLVIRPNIDNAGYFTTGVRAAIDITGAGRSGTGAVGMVQRIEVGGSVRNCNVGALYAQYVDGLSVVGLVTERCNLSPWVAGLGATAYDTVLIANSRNIALDGVASSSGAGTIRALPECTGIRWGANPGMFYYGPGVDPIILPANLTLISGGNGNGAGAALDIKTGANPTFSPMARIKGHFYSSAGAEQQGGLEVQTRAVGVAGQPLVTRADFDAFGAFRWNVLDQIDAIPNGFMTVQKTGAGAARILWRDTDGVLRAFAPTWTPI